MINTSAYSICLIIIVIANITLSFFTIPFYCGQFH